MMKTLEHRVLYLPIGYKTSFLIILTFSVLIILGETPRGQSLQIVKGVS